MIRRLDEENLTYAFPEVAFDNDYVIATYQAKVQTKNIEKLAMAIADEQTTGTWIRVGADSLEKTRRFGSKLVALYEVPDRPLLNAMIKPNIGWTPDEGADLFYRACRGAWTSSRTTS